MNVLSLFDGISCGRLALDRAGIKYDNYFASEIDKNAIKVAQSNFPDTIQLGDIRNIKAVDLPKIDLLIGGSPCQGFSFAGQHLNLDDPRSILFFEFLRLLKECGPEFFLLENVSMSKKSSQLISDFLEVDYREINSSSLSAQNRKRLYWTNIPIEPLIEKNITFDYINQKSDIWLSESRINQIKVWTARRNPLDFSICIGRGDKVPCLLASNYTSGFYLVLVTDGKRYRLLFPDERELAQTLPLGYTMGFSDTQRSNMIGNGWTVDVIAHIFGGLKRVD